MEEGIKPELVDTLKFLLPGLLAAWVYYALTAFRRPEVTERIIQALIFTVFVQFLVYCEHAVAIWVGESVGVLGAWTEQSAYFAAGVTALVFGALAAWTTTKDKLFGILRGMKLTSQMAYPTEWYGVFVQEQGYVVLHLKDDRRLSGVLRFTQRRRCALD